MPKATHGVFALLALWAASTGAQQTTLAPSPEVSCLTPAAAERGEPEYPFREYKSAAPGRVKATATFEGNDLLPWPAVRIDSQEGDDAFVAEVKAHLRTLRMPCLKRGAKATLQYDFVFVPGSGEVFWGAPVDLADEARRQLVKCVASQPGHEKMSYPNNALNSNIQGRVWASIRFDAPDRPPQVVLHSRPKASVLAREVELWLAQRRMPCLPAGEVIAASQTFDFVIEGGAYGFKPMTLTQYLGNVKDIGKRRLTLDTRTMGCPFQLKVVYRQPDAPNVVGEVGEPNPARKPLLDLLAASSLDMRNEALDAVYADTADITVPCIKIDLKPPEKTS